jgi:ribosomal protein L11 methyltransferase
LALRDPKPWRARATQRSGVGEKYVEITVVGTDETADALADFLLSEGALGLVTEAAAEEPDGIRIRASFCVPPPVTEIVARLARYRDSLKTLGLAGGENRIAVREIPTEDWGRAWKAHFRPLPVGRRLVIAPPWEDEGFPADRRVVRIDPGMSFGTGHHATTRMCLEALEAFMDGWDSVPGPRVLDVGTGTGILGIAAAVLGAERVVACDIDPEACAAAARNCALNAGADRIQILHGGPEALKGGVEFELVVANLDTKTLYPLVGTLQGLLASGGRLVVSGILVEEEETLTGAAAASGLRVISGSSDGEWLCVVLLPSRSG